MVLQEGKGPQEIHSELTRPKLPLTKETVTETPPEQETVTETPPEQETSRYPKRTRRPPDRYEAK